MSRVERLKSFYEHDPQNSALICDLLDAYMQDGVLQECIRFLADLPDHVRSQPGVRFREARVAMLRGELEDAASLLQSLLDSGTDAWAIRHDLALVQSHMGDPEAALQTLSPLLSDSRTDSSVRLLEARLRYSKGELDTALEVTENVLRASPDEADAQGLRALLLFDMGEISTAREAAERCLSTHPGQSDAMLVAGTVALWDQRLDVAETALSEVARNPAFAGRALSGLGQLHMVQGELPRAIETLELAVQRMPGHIGTWHALAWCQLLSGDVGGAQRSIEKAFELDRSFGETHGGFAIVHALHGRTEEAEAAIRRAQRLDPNGRNFLYAKALLLRAEGRNQEAVLIVAGVLESVPSMQGQDPAAVLDRLAARMERRD
ncbi:hypothetical protein GCM10027285_26690 [Oleiagrimonas citrea]|uniref:Tetratricopeptide repeat protein n=1 Tax=Oleiagrimonas citrea TaxID=1665687 RepID=A0A846ZN79_9GAMM|nr:tetratricopeptide repeat protein [Oleiagrimonas citrea]NKZ39009.1 tetratricopeptide repeat protein [Oleiagrimonas citrea]